MFVKRFFLLFTLLITCNSLMAQLCQGSLGDPVVNITFGSGSGFGAPLGSAITNYNYVSNICPNDGSYTIESYVNNCFGGSWHTVTEDHTVGDVNGYMMVVNASITPGDFYLDTVRNLCGGTTYEFAAWLLNVLKSSACQFNGIKPNITFHIESTTGAVLQTYSTGDIVANSSPVWNQYGLFFTTPPSITSVVLRMTNNATGGCGNDILLDDITFRPCGPKVVVNINGSLANKTVCTGDTTSFIFRSTVNGFYPSIVYQWQKSTDGVTWVDIPGANSQLYSNPSILIPGNYFFRLTVAQANNISISSCRIASDPVTITVAALPVPAASNNGPACENSNVSLSATGGSMYIWNGPNNFTSNIQSPVITNASLNNNGKYYVNVTTANGCINVDSTVVIIYQKPVVDAGNDATICEGKNTILHGTTMNSISWSWSPVQSLSDPLSLNPAASPDKTTLYIFKAANGSCVNSDSVLITVITKPVANAGPDKAIVGNQTITLDGRATGSNIFYYWTPVYFLTPDSVLNPKVSPPVDTAYILHVISKDGCGESVDTVLVKYYKEIYIPNAFTPNNDGLNDRWNIAALGAFPAAETKVYNRFGQLIFHTTGNNVPWDGRFKGIPQPADVYCYTIDLKNGFKVLSGFLVLIR